MKKRRFAIFQLLPSAQAPHTRLSYFVASIRLYIFYIPHSDYILCPWHSRHHFIHIPPRQYQLCLFVSSFFVCVRFSSVLLLWLLSSRILTAIEFMRIFLCFSFHKCSKCPNEPGTPPMFMGILSGRANEIRFTVPLRQIDSIFMFRRRFVCQMLAEQQYFARIIAQNFAVDDI